LDYTIQSSVKDIKFSVVLSCGYLEGHHAIAPTWWWCYIPGPFRSIRARRNSAETKSEGLQPHPRQRKQLQEQENRLQQFDRFDRLGC